MNSDHENIIEELLKMDPSLGDDRPQLEKAVEAMLAAKPADAWRPEFEQELLEHLRSEMHHKTTKAPSYFFPTLTMVHNALFAGGGAVFGALLIFALAQTGTLPLSDDASESPGAFGSLAMDKASESQAYGLGGGGDAAMNMARPQSGGGGGMAESMIMPPEEYVQTRYNYNGTIELPSSDVEVYRRIKPTSKPSASTAARGFAESLLNWSALGSFRVQTMQLTQGDLDGFNVFIDHNEGTLSINRNIDPTTRPDYGCRDEACFERARLREGDMISDERAISIAQSFAQQYGLDLSKYGEPVIGDNWRARLAATAEKSMFYFPEELMVIFPLEINGKPVYEEYGMPYGLNIGVDIRQERVNNVFNYQLQNFDTATYAPLTDVERAKQTLRMGSIYFWEDPSAKVAEAQVGEPVEGYMHYFKWNEATGQGNELFVPALVFPITDMPENSLETRQNVIVPLAADIYEGQNDAVPLPRPLMMEDGGAAGIFEEGQVPEGEENLEVK